MVRNTRQTGVKGHHQKSELHQRPQETSATPSKPRLQVELEEETEKKKTEASALKQGCSFVVDSTIWVSLKSYS